MSEPRSSIARFFNRESPASSGQPTRPCDALSKAVRESNIAIVEALSTNAMNSVVDAVEQVRKLVEVRYACDKQSALSSSGRPQDATHDPTSWRVEPDDIHERHDRLLNGLKFVKQAATNPRRQTRNDLHDLTMELEAIKNICVDPDYVPAFRGNVAWDSLDRLYSARQKRIFYRARGRHRMTILVEALRTMRPNAHLSHEFFTHSSAPLLRGEIEELLCMPNGEGLVHLRKYVDLLLENDMGVFRVGLPYRGMDPSTVRSNLADSRRLVGKIVQQREFFLKTLREVPYTSEFLVSQQDLLEVEVRLVRDLAKINENWTSEVLPRFGVQPR